MQTNATQSAKQWLAAFDLDVPDIRVDSLTLDSRNVAIHSAFIAVKGHERDGREFIPQAISLGAKLIIAQTDEADEHGAITMREQSVIVHVFNLPELISDMAAAFYHYPAQQLDVIAVTGTNGKTSTVQLISQLRRLIGDTSASIGTLGSGIYQLNDAEINYDDTLNTTPDAVTMQSLMADFVASGVKQVALEASSHALVQHRIAALDTKVAVFTNLTRDHLDYHGSMAEYARAKRLLLTQPSLQFAVLNRDDEESLNWHKAMPEGVTPVWVSASGDKPDAKELYCVATQIEYLPNGISLNLDSSWGQGTLSVRLLGAFNITNLLSALASLLCLQVPLRALLEHSALLRPVPGRMEVFGDDASAHVVVDYAHTPDALHQALLAVRQHNAGRVWCIFGCGGERDQGKRVLMGEIAEQLAERVILTNDNSRSEDPQAIISDILSGMRAPDKVQIELDRRVAIQSCLKQASAEDMILVAGKGHETYQIIGDTRHDYNEREYIKHLFVGREQ
ncbi:UDP-N-acetylmuramoyl-L-alanyl-D-glutamate--2,6-diaminopimelate ligase [Aestuariibacter salexigens]|uniref:UDP-N-acetylmuramoyl-L-alanyl-D-glutamate--2, 6-diaminopimelate ligase n=1 Tax=Aestuariibacter salexigens TaxID=226010 RepID=UPI00041CD0D4|nr:UDP-N-acetylmuramoyl-L-alanyl-D-glutamate--2,6-diaminopimelate ligase [Aestuariibacter salexigens]